MTTEDWEENQKSIKDNEHGACFLGMIHSYIENKNWSKHLWACEVHSCSYDGKVFALFQRHALVCYHQRHTEASSQLLQWPFLSSLSPRESKYIITFVAFIGNIIALMQGSVAVSPPMWEQIANWIAVPKHETVCIKMLLLILQFY